MASLREHSEEDDVRLAAATGASRNVWQCTFAFVPEPDLFLTLRRACRSFCFAAPLAITSLAATDDRRAFRRRDFRGILNDAVLRTVASSCRELRVIDLPACKDVSDASLRALGAGCQRLVYANVSACAVSPAGIAALASGCPELESLQAASLVGGANDLAFASAGSLSRLRYLDLSGSPSHATDAGLAAVAQGCPLMEVFMAANCGKFTDEGLAALSCLGRLEGLNLRGRDAHFSYGAVASLVAAVPSLVAMSPSADFNIAMHRESLASPARAGARIRVTCGMCGQQLFRALAPSACAVDVGSQSQITNEVYCDEEPEGLHLWRRQHMYNCRRNCHAGVKKWIVDGGSGMIPRRNYQYALACGDEFCRISWFYRKAAGADAPDPGLPASSCNTMVTGLGCPGSQPYDPDLAAAVEARLSGRMLYSEFHREFFVACGKLPASPDFAEVSRLTRDPRFSGRADDYVDAVGSSALMYAVGPITEDSLLIFDLLVGCFGASAVHRNDRGQTAMAYAKAWLDFCEAPHVGAGMIKRLADAGCNPAEPHAF